MYLYEGTNRHIGKAAAEETAIALFPEVLQVPRTLSSLGRKPA